MSPYELVDSEKAAFPSARCAKPSACHEARTALRSNTAPPARELANQRIRAETGAIHVENEPRYGSPSIVDGLRAPGHEVGKHGVARLMREIASGAHRRRFRHMTDSRHKLLVAPNLPQQNFTATAPNQALIGDITYIWTAEGCWYLAALVDLYSRRVFGWAMRKSLEPRARGLGAPASTDAPQAASGPHSAHRPR